MCGIVFGLRRDGHGIKKQITKIFNAQRARGLQGFGYVTIEKGKIGNVCRAETEGEIMKLLNKEKSGEILFHHRLPTSTPNMKEMAHPILVSNNELDYDYYVVHNGVLRNEDELKKIHNKLGYAYTTEYIETNTISIGGNEKVSQNSGFNDSEALAIELARYLDGQTSTIDAEGTIAFVAIQADKKGNVRNIFFGRNLGNPLFVDDRLNSVKNGLFFLRSSGDGITATAHNIYRIQYDTMEITQREINIGKVAYVPPHTAGFHSPYRDYSDYEKSIYDKPKVIQLGGETPRETVAERMHKRNIEIYERASDGLTLDFSALDVDNKIEAGIALQSYKRKISDYVRLAEKRNSAKHDWDDAVALHTNAKDEEREAWHEECQDLSHKYMLLDNELFELESEILDYETNFGFVGFSSAQQQIDMADYVGSLTS